ncbi:MAG: hypothetical protein GX456_12760 [Verrucomicrobia bacterium]|nr:hypothetical protein [Verrucomicrobiota bacterium]
MRLVKWSFAVVGPERLRKFADAVDPLAGSAGGLLLIVGYFALCLFLIFGPYWFALRYVDRKLKERKLCSKKGEVEAPRAKVRPS